MKTISKGLYKGKPRGYYDPSPQEIFMTELGQEIFKFTDEHQHKSQMTDEDWNTYCTAADKCVRFGTVWGPKTLDAFSKDEQKVLKLFLDKRKDNE